MTCFCLVVSREIREVNLLAFNLRSVRLIGMGKHLLNAARAGRAS